MPPNDLGRAQSVLVDHANREVRKIYLGRSAVVEAASLSAAAQGQTSSPSFLVPRLLSVDAERNELRMELLPGLISFQALLQSGALEGPCGTLLSRLGQVLRHLHGIDLPLSDQKPASYAATSTQLLDSNTAPGFMHGDFTVSNTFFTPRTNEIALLDWCAAPVLNDDVNWGDQMWDLVWFSRSLAANAPRHQRHQATVRQIEVFVDGYCSCAPETSIETKQRVARRMDSLVPLSVWRNRSWLRRIAQSLAQQS